MSNARNLANFKPSATGQVETADIADAAVTAGKLDTGAAASNLGNYVSTVNSATGAVTVQETLVSGTNIKTLNSESLLGSGNITISAPAAFPSGTVMLFGQTTAPTGWTKDTTNYNNSGLRVVTGSASTGGSVDFTTAFASQTPAGSISINTSGLSAGSTTLTTAQMPSHSHSGGSTSSASNAGGDPGNVSNIGSTGSTGGGGSHSHSISGSASATFTGTAINLAVKYVDVIRATKD